MNWLDLNEGKKIESKEYKDLTIKKDEHGHFMIKQDDTYIFFDQNDARLIIDFLNEALYANTY